jgi:hypothetical protein
MKKKKKIYIYIYSQEGGAAIYTYIYIYIVDQNLPSSFPASHKVFVALQPMIMTSLLVH